MRIIRTVLTVEILKKLLTQHNIKQKSPAYAGDKSKDFMQDLLPINTYRPVKQQP